MTPLGIPLVKGPTIAALLVLLGALCSCDIGTGEKFIVTSATGCDLGSHNGTLCIVPGNSLVGHGRTMGPPENLLYLLIVCPGIAASAHGQSTEYGHPVNVYSSAWATDKGTVSVRVRWNKRSDKVLIGNLELNRGAGNMFVVERQPTAKLVVTQLANAGPNLGAEAAVAFIRQHMTNDALVASIRLPTRD